MQTTFKQQIEAIGIAMSTEDVRNLPQSIRLALNDAASTIAALNLGPPQSLKKEIEALQAIAKAEWK